MTDQTTTIPKGWKMTTLGEVAELSKSQWKSGDADQRYIGLEHINQGDLTINDFGNSLKLDSNKFYFKKDDVLFGKLRPYFRKVWKARFGGVCSTEIWVIRAKENNDQGFLFYLAANPVFVDKSMGASKGTHMPRADWGYLQDTEWAIPPLPEQRAIAAVLSSLDDKIELLREQNKTLEATAQEIFKEWFVKFNFPVEFEVKSEKLKVKNKGYRNAGGKMIDSELGKIPEGWRVGKIKDLIDILSGFSFLSSEFSQNGKYKLVTIKNVQDRYFDSTTTDTLKEIPEKMPAHCKLESGDILLSLTGNVGRICLVNGEGYLLNQRVAKLKAKDSIDYAFTYLLFLQDAIFSLLQSTASGTAQQNLSPIQTKEIEIIIANRRTLDQFGWVANKLVQKINENLSQIQTLSTLRDTLLPKVMKGEVRVKGFKN